MKKIAFIGMGNMASALAKGFIKSGKIAAKNIFAYAPNQDKLKENSLSIGFVPCSTLKQAVSSADTVFMACKPYQIESVLLEIKPLLEEKALVSIALGWNFHRYVHYLSDLTRIQFVMPNTPSLVGEGVFLFEKSNSLRPEERNSLMDLFSSIGIVEELEDSLMGIGGAISGCGPAFADIFIEAYADAACKYGLSRKTAYRLISKTLLGSAKLQLETETHPAILKDNVCSPAGSTIKGVAALEEAGLRHACIHSIDAIMSQS